jgi:hypothetical protein
MPRRLCLGFRGETCNRIVEGNRCIEHGRLYEQHRRPVPSARQRYPASHDVTRAQLLPLAYGQPCPRCGQPMLRGQALDLGHLPGAPRATHPTSHGARIEHAHCNRSAGAA